MSAAKKNQKTPRRGWEPVLGAIVGVLIVGAIFFLTNREERVSSGSATSPSANDSNAPAAPLPQAPPAGEIDRVRRIEVAEARRLLESGQAISIDVRDAQSYVAGHIPGALQIPLEYVPGEIPWFPRDKMIITYCT